MQGQNKTFQKISSKMKHLILLSSAARYNCIQIFTKFMKFKSVTSLCWVTSSDGHDHRVEENSNLTYVLVWYETTEIGTPAVEQSCDYSLCIFLPCRAYLSWIWGAQEGLCSSEPFREVGFSFPMLIFLALL